MGANWKSKWVCRFDVLVSESQVASLWPKATGTLSWKLTMLYRIGAVEDVHKKKGQRGGIGAGQHPKKLLGTNWWNWHCVVPLVASVPLCTFDGPPATRTNWPGEEPCMVVWHSCAGMCVKWLPPWRRGGRPCEGGFAPCDHVGPHALRVVWGWGLF